VFLVYRLPREPSAPRIALWRALRRLGALLLSDGLVALPNTARNREHLEWLAAGIQESHGSASVWAAQPVSAMVDRDYRAQVSDAVDEEYRALQKEAVEALALDEGERRRVLRRLRAQLRRIASRDYFGAPAAGEARDAVQRLAREGVKA
jgi:hypothetical protein